MGNPTGDTLPALVYDGKTRVGAEVLIYYNLMPSYKLAEVGIDGDSNEVVTIQSACGAGGSLPASGFTAIRARVPIGDPDDSVWTIDGNDGTLPGYAPPDQAAEVGNITSMTTSTTASVTNSTPGDAVDVVRLPHPAGDVLLCYDQGMSIEIPEENRPIPRKFDSTDHYVRQRAEKTINISDLRISNLDGLARLKDRDITLILKFFPSGGSIASEIVYLTKVRLSTPFEIPEDANESVLTSATGSFSDRFVFTAPPT